MIKKFAIINNVLFLISITTVILFASGCKGNDFVDNEFLKYDRKLGDFDVSYEYPASFKLHRPEDTGVLVVIAYERYSATDQITGTLLIEGLDPEFADLMFYPYTDTNTGIAFILSQREGFYKDFEVLAQSPVTISGVEGVKIFSRYRQASNFSPYYLDIPAIEGDPYFIDRNVFFEKGNYIWRVQILSEQRTAKEDDFYFERLIKTLEILD